MGVGEKLFKRGNNYTQPLKVHMLQRVDKLGGKLRAASVNYLVDPKYSVKFPSILQD